jgi:polyribonucleotide nucleotidyltransferase
VLVDMADTEVLVTAVGRKTADPGRDFFPLTVNYQEKTYAAGKIPGGFFKREGRPSEKGNPDLAADRSSDPAAVPEGVQERSPDYSDRGFAEPRHQPGYSGADRRIGSAGDLRHAVRRPDRRGAVGYIDGSTVLNPANSQLENTQTWTWWSPGPRMLC